jgi:voltage-gated potassium channel
MEPGDAAEGRRPAGGRIGRRKGAPSTPVRLADLPKPLRRKALLRSAAIIGLSWALIFGAFFVLPIGHESGLRAVLRIGAVVALIVALLAWQIQRISKAELPELRAAETLGVVIAVFLVAFSAIYLSLSHHAPWNFTQRLDQVRALYFTVSVFSTVGFGDITPRTDPARMIVSAQMLLDLALIGAGVRLILNVAKSSFDSAEGTAVGDES